MIISVKVKTNQKNSEILIAEDSLFENLEEIKVQTFIVKTKSPPLQGKANLEVIKLLAEHFGVNKNNVRILKGISNNFKIIEIKL